MNENKLAERLTELRTKKKNKDKRWTQEYVADILSISRAAYTSYETGKKNPPLDVLIHLSDIYGVSLDYLVGKIDKEDGTFVQEISEEVKALLEIINSIPEEKQEGITNRIIGYIEGKYL